MQKEALDKGKMWCAWRLFKKIECFVTEGVV